MTIETATYIDGLNASNPGPTDLKSEGDDHMRLVKSTIKATFPNITGAVTKTHTEINNALTADGSGNYLVGAASNPNLDKMAVGGAIGVQGAQFNASPGASTDFEMVNRNGAGWKFYVNNAGSVAMTIGSDGTVTVPGTLAAAVPWTSVSGKPSNISYFSNDSGYQTTAGTVTNCSGGFFSGTIVSASGAITSQTDISAYGRVFGHVGSGGTGLGKISTTTTTGTPSGTNVGDMVLVY